MAKQPIVPRSLVNPVGQTDRINRTATRLIDAIDDIEHWLLETFNAIPVKPVLVNNLYVNTYRYDYQIDVYELERIIRQMSLEFDGLPNDMVRVEVLGAYEQGTGLAATNLASLTDDYTRHITAILVSEPYQRRAAIVGARTFEEMKGFEGDASNRLARILRRGVQDSLPPLDVSGQIEQEFGVTRNRAETIARTEITGALRRGRWDEAQDARDRLALNVGLLWVSALKPTTRIWHATRHSEIYSIQAVREFYAVNANAINCYCTQVEIILDNEGKPVSKKLIERMQKQKEDYFN